MFDKNMQRVDLDHARLLLCIEPRADGVMGGFWKERLPDMSLERERHSAGVKKGASQCSRQCVWHVMRQGGGQVTLNYG